MTVAILFAGEAGLEKGHFRLVADRLERERDERVLAAVADGSTDTRGGSCCISWGFCALVVSVLVDGANTLKVSGASIVERTITGVPDESGSSRA
jgi:hypothetical protein